MLKKEITYTDYNGVKKTRAYYFNLSKAEILEMELGHSGGLTAMLNRIMANEDTPALVKIFKDIILKSYGEKSDDGERFIKSPAIAEAFSQTEAYSELFMLLSTNADEAAAFINGIVPSDVKRDEAGTVVPGQFAIPTNNA